MSNDEARRLVSDGLKLRRYHREEAEKDARMDAYEKEMISACNDHCANARTLRSADEDARQVREQMVAARKAQREQMQKEWERDNRVWDTLRKFLFFCMAVALVTVWTPFPWWGAVALIFGTTAMVGAYIFRVYYPV